MLSPSNLYAEKIFSEHPTAMWALDDKLDYVSLISENDRNISLWNDSDSGTRTGVFGGTVQTTSVLNEPFSDSVVNLFIGEMTNNPSGQIECISSDLINGSILNFLDLDQDMATFSIGAYFYSDSNYLSGVHIGYEYFDSASGQNVQNLKYFSISVSERWMFVSETFDIPADNTNLRLVIKIDYIGGAPSQDSYHFLMNGLSFGQWSEEFNSSSLGMIPIDLPSIIDLPSSKVIEAKAYGLQNLSGYYFTEGNTTYAKNSGIPMVYGASNLTILSPNTNKPSLIIPSDGFLNDSGKYKTYTFETWLKISCDSITEKRIFGPISGSDGLYVRGSFITLKVGNTSGAYSIGEWLRPMLVHIIYTPTTASLMINGEEVISLSIDASTIDFPEQLVNGKSQEWLGFYAYDDVSPIEIDCVAIYPYQVSQIVAKRRWVYGQGVEFPENINTAYSGTSVFVDYPFADYANSYSYPDIGKWEQGVLDNLISDGGSLMPPNYKEPSVVFNNKTYNDWHTAIGSVQNELNNFMCLKPSSEWNSTDGYLYFDRLDMLRESVKGFYGVFKQKEATIQDQVLFFIQDTSNLNYFKIVLSEHRLRYILKHGSVETLVYETSQPNIGEEFSVGLDINKFVEYFGGSSSAFFGKKTSLKAYIGGTPSFEDTFAGNIYKIGFSSSRNLSKISQFFSEKGLVIDEMDTFGVDGGIPSTTYWVDLFDGNLPSTPSWELSINPNSDYPTPALITTTSLLEYTASYTLKLNNYFNDFKLDIAIDSYWEDYLPLTYFAKYVKDADNFSYYDLDFIQFNVNYPAPSKFIQEETSSSWNYAELHQKYSVPVQRTYDSLDNQLFTGYENYNDLKNSSFKTYKYDTSDSIVKTYVTFQYLKSGANASMGYFVNNISPDKNGIVNPGTYIVGANSNGDPVYDNFENTKYEVVDNMVIYPPANVDFSELAIVTHVEIVIDGIFRNPLKIKKMHYASQALNDTTPKGIGTRFGTKIYPYKKTGVYYDYKSINPFSIYTGSSPYLYTTRNSGIQVRGNYDPLVGRGLQIPINQAKESGYKVIASQMSMRFDGDFFPYAPTEIMQIESKNSLIKFYLVANHPQGKRAKIYAVNAKTGRLENGIAFYWNGKIVKEPNISVKEWGMLGIRFSNSLNLNSYSGYLRITGPITINNMSHYKSTNLQEVQQVANRPWFKVKSSGAVEFDWQYWEASYIWNGVLVLSSTSYYGVDPSDIYKTYTGTNKIIVDDTRPFRLNSYQYSLIKDVGWQTQVTTPV